MAIVAHVLALACALLAALPAGSAADQASQPLNPEAGRLEAGNLHSCAVVTGGAVRCWGFGAEGRLGYGNTNTVGDDETPAAVGPVDLGPGRTATAVGTGDYHSCALLDTGRVMCWGFGADGRLGYANTNNIGDDESPAAAGTVDLGVGRTAIQISVGGAHTCALLDDHKVMCWGYGAGGALGYGNLNSIGDNEAPAAAGTVDLGPGRTAVAVSAGSRHTCALLDDGTVRCWGNNSHGELGVNSTTTIGDNEPPTDVAPVPLGPGRTATAISAGGAHTCALLDNGAVRCWGYGGNGQLGYGSPNDIGDDEPVTAVGTVNLGVGHTAVAISAGGPHTCARLEDDNVRCWGYNGNGQLGYANTSNIGDDETPNTVGPVYLGAGRTDRAISAGQSSTCARLDDGSVRCWGLGANGLLGYCSPATIGDDEQPGAAGPVNLVSGDGGMACPPRSSPTATAAVASSSSGGQQTASSPPLASDAARARGLRSCLTAVAARARRDERALRRASARKRAAARRRLKRRASAGRTRCLRLFARTPGAVTGLRARPVGRTQVELEFAAPGTDGTHPPPATSYVVKQSRRLIRGARDFSRAQTLCGGRCRFKVTAVGGTVRLTVTDLRPRTTYYYAVSARDNVSARRGPRSATVSVRTG